MRHFGMQPDHAARSKIGVANTKSIMCAKEISTGNVRDATELTAYNLSAGCVCSCSQANYLLRNSAMHDSIGSS